MWIWWIPNKFAKLHAKRLNRSENIPKRFRGLLFWNILYKRSFVNWCTTFKRKYDCRNCDSAYIMTIPRMSRWLAVVGGARWWTLRRLHWGCSELPADSEPAISQSRIIFILHVNPEAWPDPRIIPPINLLDCKFRTTASEQNDILVGAVAPRVWNDLPADIVSAP